jgi:hypothetical protein
VINAHPCAFRRADIGNAIAAKFAPRTTASLERDRQQRVDCRQWRASIQQPLIGVLQSAAHEWPLQLERRHEWVPTMLANLFG